MVRIGNAVYYSHGHTSKAVLDRLTSCKAFIYALEFFAKLMAVFMLASRLPTEWVAFIDNTAGEAALKKGYGKDAFVNAILSVFWATAARQSWRPVNVADAISRANLSPGPSTRAGN